MMNFGISMEHKQTLDEAFKSGNTLDAFYKIMSPIPLEPLLKMYKYFQFADKKVHHIMYKETQGQLDINLLSDFLSPEDRKKIVMPVTQRERLGKGMTESKKNEKKVMKVESMFKKVENVVDVESVEQFPTLGQNNSVGVAKKKKMIGGPFEIKKNKTEEQQPTDYNPWGTQGPDFEFKKPDIAQVSKKVKKDMEYPTLPPGGKNSAAGKPKSKKPESDPSNNPFSLDASEITTGKKKKGKKKVVESKDDSSDDDVRDIFKQAIVEQQEELKLNKISVEQQPPQKEKIKIKTFSDIHSEEPEEIIVPK